MKIEYFFYSNPFGNRKVKARLAAIFLILSVFFSPGVSLSSGGTSPQSITILYSNNINGEIDPCHLIANHSFWRSGQKSNLG